MLDIHTNLFILKQKDFGDLDRVITVFTSDFGKRIIKLKSSYKFLSKLNSNLQLFSIVNCDIIIGKSFDKICNANIEKIYNNMITDIRKNISYVFISEIVDNYMDFNFSDKRIYDLCVGYFDFIDNMKLNNDSSIVSIDFNRDKSLIKVLYGFFVNFLKINGIGIVSMGNKISNKADFFNFVYNNIEKRLNIEEFFS
jgi:hypothetical protein